MQRGGIVDAFPCRDAAGRDDQPELAVVDGAGRVTHGGFGAAIRVAVIMADNALAAGARLAVAAEQQGGIDLETAPRIGGDIGRRHGAQRCTGRADQQPATFGGGSGYGFGQQRSGKPT